MLGARRLGSNLPLRLKKEQTKMASRSRLDLKFCAGLLKAACRQGSITWFCQEELKTTGTQVTIHLNHVLFNFINAIVNSAAYEAQ